MKKFVIYGFLVILTAGAIILVLNKNNGNDDEIKLITTEKGAIAEIALAVGTIEPENEIKVKSTFPGIVSDIYFKIGDRVEKNKPLFNISPNPTPLEYAETRRNMELAEVILKQARREQERTTSLFESEMISKSDMEVSNALYNEASLRYKIAGEKFELLEKGRIKLSGKNINSIVKAPISGVILTQDVYKGDPVVPLTNFQPGTELCSMADMKQMRFKGTVDEIDVGKLDPGMIADIQVGALPAAKVKGRLERISPKARKDGNSTLFDIEIEILEISGKPLRAGYSATANVKIRESKDTLIIPERLVIIEGDKRYVEVKEGEKISRREIETGLSDSINIEVLKGLKEGEKIVERPPREIQ
ncbi:MAG: efflux RND transporter periplasmic adaptor subunit [Candidatus Aminicenantes bacterium]|nr:efflux RND transporter periplasmic adaptor subunit [Candidatus Aminicenantes bacterium]